MNAEIALEIDNSLLEECDRLASTIGRVMEEAGERVDSNIDELKREYTEKLRKMEILLKKVEYRNLFNPRNRC